MVCFGVMASVSPEVPLELRPPGIVPPVIGRFARFVSSEVELEYRRTQLGRDKRILVLLASLISAAYLTFVTSDQVFLADAPGTRLTLVIVRALVIGLAIGVAIYGWGRNRPIDRVLTTAVGLVVLSALYIAVTRPPYYTGAVALEAMTILGIYLLVPLPFLRQTILGLTATAGHLVILYVVRTEASTPTQLALSFAFVAANVLGAVASWHLHVSRREQYAAVEQERALRQRLQSLLDAVETLRGVVPICFGCKKIRDEGGAWHEVEVYVAKHSLANFSHGLCEDCVEKYYPPNSK